MSKYTTGELAKLCGVSVRTVQYYDTRGLLVPSETSEGGRRLYSEDDVKRMKIICFLKDLGLPLNTVSQILSEEHSEDVIDLLLLQQQQILRGEIDERREKLLRLETLQKQIRTAENFSVESIGDIAYIMENKKKLWKVRALILGVGIPLELIEIGTLIYAVKTGIWWPFIAGIALVIVGAIWLSAYYYKNVEYICPRCHEVFKPTFGQTFWAAHTPSTRKLTCPKCGHRGYCVETYRRENPAD